MHRPSPVHRSWSIHTRMAGARYRRPPDAGDRPLASGRCCPPPPSAYPGPSSATAVVTTDDWAWLRDRDDPDTRAYLEAENAYADAWFGTVAPLQQAVFAEIKARTQETDLSVPVRKGPYWYYRRTVEGLEYPVHCRRPLHQWRRPRRQPPTPTSRCWSTRTSRPGARGTAPTSSSAPSRSVPGTACWRGAIDTDGSEVFRLRVRDLDTGADLPRRDRAHLSGRGVVGRRSLRRSTPAPTPPCAPTRCGGTSWARPRADDVARARGARRAVLPRRRPHPQRRVDRHQRRQQHDERGPRAFRPTTRPPPRDWCAPGATATSTPSTTGATASSS